MPTWEKVIVAVLALGLLIFLGPRIMASMKNSPKGTSKDWLGVIFILGLVVLFVLLMILSV